MKQIKHHNVLFITPNISIPVPHENKNLNKKKKKNTQKKILKTFDSSKSPTFRHSHRFTILVILSTEHWR